MSSNANPKKRKGRNPETYGNPNQNFEHLYVVRGDMSPEDGEKNYDTLSTIAEEWLRLNPTATSIAAGDIAGARELRGNKWSKIKAIVRWIDEENLLKDAQGRICNDRNGKKFTYPLILEGMKLDLPMNANAPELAEGMEPIQGKTVRVTNPRQGSDCGGAKACLVKNGDTVAEPIVTAEPIVEPIVTAEPPKKDIEPSKLYFSTRQPSASSEGARINPYSTQWNLEVLAMTGEDMNFSKEWWSLKNITPNKRARSERYTGEADTENYGRQGKNAGGNKLSRQDNADMAKGFYMNGNGPWTADKGRPFTNGYVASIGDDGVMTRMDETVSAWVRDGNYASTAFGRVWDKGDLGGVPVGISAFNPSKQMSMFSKTGRHGITQVRAALAEVNLGGKHNIWADQQTWLSNFMEAPNRIGEYTMVKVAYSHFQENMEAVETATTAEDKKAAAIEALKAFRDLKDNPMIRTADSNTHGPLLKAEEAIQTFLATETKLDIASLNEEVKDLTKHPRVLPKTMTAEQKEELLNSHIPDKRITHVIPGESSKVYEMLIDQVYVTQNSVEFEIAQGKGKLLEEPAMIQASREAWKLISRYPEDEGANKEAAAAFGDFVARDHGAAVEVGSALSDILKNPKNYGLKDKEAEALVKQLCGNDADENSKLVFQNIDYTGKTPRLFGLNDKPFAVSRADLIGPTVGKVLKENPELFAKFADTISGEEKGANSDGRRHGIALLRALGAEHGKDYAENGDAKGLRDVIASLGDAGEAYFSGSGAKKGADIIRESVRDAVVYAESGSSGRSATAAVYLDNVITKEQLNATTRKTDMNALYDKLFTSTEAREIGANRVAVEGLKAHPGLARDVVLATMLRNPDALREVEDVLKNDSRSLKKKLHKYDELRDVLKDAREAAADYKASGDDKDLTKATQKLGRYFTKLEDAADGKSERVKVRAEQRVVAWDAMMDAIGKSDAMSAAMVDTMKGNEGLRNAFIASTRETVLNDDAPESHVPGKVTPLATNGDALYQSQFFALPTKKGDLNSDKEGKVDSNKGLFGLTKRQVTVNADAIKAVVKGTAPAAANSSVYDALIATLPADTRDTARDLLVNGKLEGLNVSSLAGVKEKNQDEALGKLLASYQGKADDKAAVKSLTKTVNALMDAGVLTIVNSEAGVHLQVPEKADFHNAAGYESSIAKMDKDVKSGVRELLARGYLYGLDAKGLDAVSKKDQPAAISPLVAQAIAADLENRGEKPTAEQKAALPSALVKPISALMDAGIISVGPSADAQQVTSVLVKPPASTQAAPTAPAQANYNADIAKLPAAVQPTVRTLLADGALTKLDSAAIGGLNAQNPTAGLTQLLVAQNPSLNSGDVKNALQSMSDAGLIKFAPVNGVTQMTVKAPTAPVNGLSADVLSQIKGIDLAAAGVSMNNALGLNPKIYMGSVGENQQPVTALTAYLQAMVDKNDALKNDPKVNNPETLQQNAQYMLDNNLVQPAQNANELMAAPLSAGVLQTMATSPFVNQGIGIDRRLILLALGFFIPTSCGGESVVGDPIIPDVPLDPCPDCPERIGGFVKGALGR